MINKIAGMNITYYRYSFEMFLDSMAKLEIPSIELWGGAPHFYLEDLTHQKIQETRKKIRDRDLTINFFTPEQCMYPISLGAEDEMMRTRSLDYFTRCLDICHSLEVDKMLVTAGLGYFDEDMEEGWVRARDSFEKLTKSAEEKGVTLALEPLSTYESNLVTDLPTLKRMLTEVNSPNLKAMVDTVPMALSGESLKRYFAEFGKDLIHIHLVDTNQHHAHLAWGDGNLPLADYLKVVEENGYEGYLTLELIGSKYTSDPEAGVVKSLNRIKNVLEKST
ncbi:protein FrlC [Halobacillus dabanensis]|uniref:Protein FrlC n=1 Tax=Halobacillus dabanensis TaxID=240302 RepID=A0A1I3S5M9_HALDA|nr:TIM barrel protein [Halobacillus dabanensis]SFJ52887.1 protein FrlC [Halobacillus dabanensis]